MNLKPEDADKLAHLLESFEYPIEPDALVLYELDRLIEEDRASFEDEEFRRAIDEGISEHVEERLDVRAALAMLFRRALRDLDGGVRLAAQRAIRAVEDIETSLRNVSVIVRTYTACAFSRLQERSDAALPLEEEARFLIARWTRGELLREQIAGRLKEVGWPAVGPLADLLFNAPEERSSSAAAIRIVGGIRCSSSARVLTHAIEEPLLPDDLEKEAYDYARALWPLQRGFILYCLDPHTHEDIPFRWYELLTECDELYAVDRIIEEVLVHAADPAFNEDLQSVLELLNRSGDPDVEQKLISTLNAPATPPEARAILEAFASRFQPRRPVKENPWARAEEMLDLNRRYRAAARLFDSGRASEAREKLTAILKEDSSYPFALALMQWMDRRDR